ncbi:MAG: hypothetical protein N4A45_01425 [Flavobacteriales bacterium]|jgi:hypothetical protein|nr:hypothetical protein [Flavobacteriales bacterium]
MNFIKWTLVLPLIIAIFSCQKEETYPMTLQFELNKEVFTTDTYTSLFTDSTLDIEAVLDHDRLHFHLHSGTNKLLVGHYPLGANSPHYLTYSSKGKQLKVKEGWMDISYLNFYTNFTFMAVLENNDTLQAGFAKNLRVDKDDYIIRTYIDSSGFAGLPNGLHATFDWQVNNGDFYKSNEELIFTETADTLWIQGTEYSFGYTVDFKIAKPLENLIGKTFSLKHPEQDQVKMTWHYGAVDDLYKVKYYPYKGEITFLSYDENGLLFTFNTKIIHWSEYNQKPEEDYFDTKDLPNGIGKYLLW